MILSTQAPPCQLTKRHTQSRISLLEIVSECLKTAFGQSTKSPYHPVQRRIRSHPHALRYLVSVGGSVYTGVRLAVQKLRGDATPPPPSCVHQGYPSYMRMDAKTRAFSFKNTIFSRFCATLIVYPMRECTVCEFCEAGPATKHCPDDVCGFMCDSCDTYRHERGGNKTIEYADHVRAKVRVTSFG